MKHQTTYRAWVHELVGATDDRHTKHVVVHLHEHLPGEDTGGHYARMAMHPGGPRCSDVLLDKEAAVGLAVGDLVEVSVSLKPVKLTTADHIAGARKVGLRQMLSTQR